MRITKDNLQDVYRAKRGDKETMQLKGYELIKELFVDSSGFGQENELALTQGGFMFELSELIEEHKALTAKITNAGQFQVYMGLFKKTKPSQIKKLANNTYKIDTEELEAIRLHDTNILTYEHDYIILNSGGFHTPTTKDRINKYLPKGVYIFQKDFDWYVEDKRDGTTKDFYDGMKIAN